jgi:hypothetical protein
VISPSNYDLEEATEKNNEYRYESSSGCGTATETSAATRSSWYNVSLFCCKNI